MSHFYSAFGLIIRSNLAVSGLVELQPFASPSVVDVELHLSVPPWGMQEKPINTGEITYSSAETNESGEPLVRIFRTTPGELLRIEFDEGATFWIDRDGQQIWSMWQAPLTLDDALSYLLGPVFGFLLRLRSIVCLHASVISIDSRAVAFVGSPGAGKSTTAAAFVARGLPVISDDIAPVVERDGLFCVLPAYPCLSLWQDSVEAAFGKSAAARPFSPNFEKQRLPLGAPLSFESRQLQLGGIFLLGERRKDGDCAVPLVSPREALMALVANSYGTNALNSKSHADELGFLGRLVAAVPAWNLHAASDLARLSDLCDLVIRQLSRPTRKPAGGAYGGHPGFSFRSFA